MPAHSADIASCKRLLLVAPDGSQFPNARNVLRAVGFAGELRVVTHREWAPLCQAQCDRVLSLPPATSPKRRLALAFAAVLLRHALTADALCWVSPPKGALRRLITVLARFKRQFCFYDGVPGAFSATREATQPALDAQGGEEAALAMKYLRFAPSCASSCEPRLRVGIDGDGIHFRAATGVQWQRRHLFATLCHEDFGLDLRVIGPVAEARSIWETPWSHRMCRVPPPLLRYAPPSRALAAPVEAVTGPIDLFHQTFFDPPKFRYPKVVATVHDVMPLALPDHFPERFANRIHAIAPFWREECARLICVSEATRNDLEKLLGIDRSRCVVIPNGRHPHFAPPSPDEIARVRGRYGLDTPYFMALGSIAPHKNLQGLCDAFAIFKRKVKGNHRLVIAGQPAWLIHEVLDKVEKSGVARDVHFIGYAEWGDLPGLYAGAEAFCMPSFYEGYGLPVQEALCCGCPVLLSNCTSLPEVAGDAGLYWNPQDAEEMAACLRSVVEDDGLRSSLRMRALQRAETFPTWPEIARAHADLYRTVAGQGGAVS